MLFRSPQHPYTVGLLGALPSVGSGDGSRRRLREIPGRVPTLREPPSACVFADRCARADTACAQLPMLGAVRPGHRVACFHPGAT